MIGSSSIGLRASVGLLFGPTRLYSIFHSNLWIRNIQLSFTGVLRDFTKYNCFFFSDLMRMVSRFDRFFFAFPSLRNPIGRPALHRLVSSFSFVYWIIYTYFFFWINFIFKDRFRCGYARVHLRPGV